MPIHSHLPAQSDSGIETCVSNPKRPVSVLVLICTAGGDVLLIERTQPHGYWQSVTGALRWGETPLAAAKREVAEETGFDTRGLRNLHRGARFPIRPAWRHRYASSVRSNREYWFVLLLDIPKRPVLNPREHRRWRWLPADQAARQASSWTNRKFIRWLFAR